MKHLERLAARRDLLKGLIAAGALPFASPAFAGVAGPLLRPEVVQEINPEFDAPSIDYWNSFLGKEATPVRGTPGVTRGGSFAKDSAQPVFLHYGPEGFQNAAELDVGKLVATGDVMVSVNTSTVKVAAQDQETFRQLQNAQLRVDVAQKTPILPVLEAMAYTLVGGMTSNEKSSKSTKKSSSAVQSINVDSDAAWQKMQNIPLPGGEGRWALNLEAQRKNSLFSQVLQGLVKEAGVFAPVLGLPGIALSALQSFNTLYGVLHSRPVAIIKAPPTRVFATQEAVQRTGAPGAVAGVMLHSGTYVLVPAKQMPPPEELSKLTVTQGRLVPPKTAPQEIDETAANTLRDMTYVTFDVEVRPGSLLGGAVRQS